MPERDQSEGDLQRTDASGPELPSTTGSPPLAAGFVHTTASPADQSGQGSIDSATPVVSPGGDFLPSAVQKLSTQLEDLASVVNARLSYDKAKEDAFDRLYADLDQLKKNAAQDNIKPLLLDLILLYDRIEHAHREAVAADGADGFIAIGTVKSFMDELLEVLYRRDVGLIEVLSPAFDPNQQRVIGVEDVADPAQHQHVAKVVRRGFRLSNRPLRPEEVVVRRFVEPTSARTGGNSGTGG